MNWSAAFIIAGYLALIWLTWPIGLLAAFIHAAVLLLFVNKR